MRHRYPVVPLKNGDELIISTCIIYWIQLLIHAESKVNLPVKGGFWSGHGSLATMIFLPLAIWGDCQLFVCTKSYVPLYIGAEAIRTSYITQMLPYDL